MGILALLLLIPLILPCFKGGGGEEGIVWNRYVICVNVLPCFKGEEEIIWNRYVICMNVLCHICLNLLNYRITWRKLVATLFGDRII